MSSATESLHDADGFPRGDVPLDKVLPLRKELQMLQSDHTVLMLTIESGLKTGMPLQDAVCIDRPTGVIVSTENNGISLEDKFKVGDVVLSFIGSATAPGHVVRIVRFEQKAELMEIPVQNAESVKQNMKMFTEREDNQRNVKTVNRT